VIRVIVGNPAATKQGQPVGIVKRIKRDVSTPTEAKNRHSANIILRPSKDDFARPRPRTRHLPTSWPDRGLPLSSLNVEMGSQSPEQYPTQRLSMIKYVGCLAMFTITGGQLTSSLSSPQPLRMHLQTAM
jgi:hypothetical protein